MRFRYSTNEQGKLVKKAIVYTINEHGINYSDVDPQAIYIVDRLWANGYESYIVGGAVRDLILKKKPKDFDIVSAANPTRIKKIFRSARIIGNRFRLVHVYFGSKIFEVSTFRSLRDGLTSNTFGNIEEDVLRRDFTLNALFYDPLKQVVVDYVGGMKDIKAKRIRPIIPLSHIFTDDPVRMLRAVKYGAATGFKLAFPLRRKIHQQAFLLSTVSPSRLTEEIFKIIHSSQAGCIVEDLDNAGLYQYLQPQAAGLFKTKEGYRDQYLKTIGALNQEGFRNLPGEALSGLVRDYLEEIADWEGTKALPAAPPSERYRNAFMAARQFVNPMNPPRVELDYAVRFLFAQHGIMIKKGRYNEKPHKDSTEARKPVQARPDTPGKKSEEVNKEHSKPRNTKGAQVPRQKPVKDS